MGLKYNISTCTFTAAVFRSRSAIEVPIKKRLCTANTRRRRGAWADSAEKPNDQLNRTRSGSDEKTKDEGGHEDCKKNDDYDNKEYACRCRSDLDRGNNNTDDRRSSCNNN